VPQPKWRRRQPSPARSLPLQQSSLLNLPPNQPLILSLILSLILPLSPQLNRLRNC
jgi:hypothetical protein